MKNTSIPLPTQLVLVDPDFPLTKPDRKAVANCTVKAQVIRADSSGAYVQVSDISDIDKHGITLFVRLAALFQIVKIEA